MNRTKIEQIKQSLNGLGPRLGEAYSNQEIIDGSIELQGAIARDFASRMQMEISRDRDVLQAIEAVAEGHQLQATEEFIRLKNNITELGYTIGSFIKGMNGEKIAKRALKLLSFDKNVKVLYNISLEDEDAQAEYDAIVVAPYGIFVIEVKNWAASMRINERGVMQREDGSDITYDLPGRMSIKEGLLREYLGDLFMTEYQGIVLFSNERAKVQDDYKKIPLSFGGSIVYDIRDYGKDRLKMSREQVDRIVEIIVANNKEQKTISKVDSEAIIEDYATLMVMLDERVEDIKEKTEQRAINIEAKDESSTSVMYNSKNSDVSSSDREKLISKLKTKQAWNEDAGFIWWDVASAVSMLFVAGLGAFTASKIIRFL